MSIHPLSSSIGSRASHLERLHHEQFDVIIIGGGATGAGTAFDAAARGLKVALIEKGDFSCGTSSKSTKLIHGGVRYLEKAFKQFDIKQYQLVTQALQERATFLKNAPHLSKPFSIVTPLYSWWEALYYFAGLKVYDWIAGGAAIESSAYIGKEEMIAAFPSLNPDALIGGVRYYDGQFDDAQANIALVLSAATQGACCCNYVEVTQLIKSSEKVVGVRVVDNQAEGSQEWEFRGQVVINATGPLSDTIRTFDNADCQPMVMPSSGTHLLLDTPLTPSGKGFLVPNTRDGRLLFVLPWEGGTLAGTTDREVSSPVPAAPTAEDIDYILSHLNSYFNGTLTHANVKSAWTGIRPLVHNPQKKSTRYLSRSHVIEVTPSRLVTICGGKWTTYRQMAEDVIDRIIEEGLVPDCGASPTAALPLFGADGYHAHLSAELSAAFPLDDDICDHLATRYGGQAWEVLKTRIVTKSLNYV